EPRQTDARWICRNLQRSTDDLAELGLGPRLQKGHAARSNSLDRALVDVVHTDHQTAVCEGDGQRQADMPTPSHHADVVSKAAHDPTEMARQGGLPELPGSADEHELRSCFHTLVAIATVGRSAVPLRGSAGVAAGLRLSPDLKPVRASKIMVRL